MGHLMKSSNKTGLVCREFRGESSVVCGEYRNGSEITGSSGGEIGKCVYCVLMVDGSIGGLEASSGTSDLGLPPLLVGSCKENIEVIYHWFVIGGSSKVSKGRY